MEENIKNQSNLTNAGGGGDFMRFSDLTPEQQDMASDALYLTYQSMKLEAPELYLIARADMREVKRKQRKRYRELFWNKLCSAFPEMFKDSLFNGYVFAIIYVFFLIGNLSDVLVALTRGQIGLALLPLMLSAMFWFALKRVTGFGVALRRAKFDAYFRCADIVMGNGKPDEEELRKFFAEHEGAGKED